MNDKGFSLVELMVVLAIAGILVVSAAPSFTKGIAQDRQAAAKDELVTAISYAKNEAALKGLTVHVSPVSGGSSGNEFKNGWNVWVDKNGNSTMDSGETLRVRGAFPSSVNVGGADLAFDSSGRVAATQTFKVCTSNTSGRGNNITVLSSGVVSTSTAISCP